MENHEFSHRKRSTSQAKDIKISKQFKGERKLKMKKFIAIGLGLTGLAYLSYQLYNLWKQSEEQDEMDEFIKIIKDWKVNQKLFNKRKNFPSNGFELDLWQPLAEEDEEIEEELEVEVEEENNMMNFDEEVNYHLYRNRRFKDLVEGLLCEYVLGLGLTNPKTPLTNFFQGIQENISQKINRKIETIYKNQ
ncbi:CLUMA_CG004623, isoform A [Clunio marinus]|uniref:CLUMA_CG004623, isoform A n=1 Tax=Clunio marinus TaxID=568069 RepID=A0A1J1HWN3_9DIPT|nr:CLUMA_CG004623, isoform A [Clunio marinus]